MRRRTWWHWENSRSPTSVKLFIFLMQAFIANDLRVEAGILAVIVGAGKSRNSRVSL